MVVLWFVTVFGALVALIGFNDAYELWPIDRTSAVLKGVAALGMCLLSAIAGWVAFVMTAS